MKRSNSLGPVIVIIIDDEPHVLEGLKTLISWSDYDLCDPLLFCDSDMAFEYMTTHQVDIVITDVNMPGKNGLEMLEQIKDNHMTTEVIIISGYRDFNYVQKAMQLGALNYLTKPVFEEDLTQVIMSARSNIEKKAERAICKKFYLDEGLLLYLYNNDSHDFKSIIEKYTHLFGQKSYMMISLMSCKLPLDKKRIIKGFNEQGLQHLEPFIMDLDNQFVLIVEMKESQLYYEEYLDRHFDGYYDVFVCKQSIEALKNRYQLICNKMTLCHHYRPSRKLINNIEHYKERNTEIYASQLINALNKSDDILLEEVIREMFILFTRLNYKPAQIYQVVIDLYSNVLSRISMVIGEIENIDVFYDVPLKIEAISVEAILMFTKRRFFKLSELVKREQFKQKESFQYETENYIKKHINKSITLKDMADHVHMHPTYLGQKLNKLWGESFTKHVHRLKIEESICLFKEGNYEHIEEVASSLGYQTYQSYLKYFKIFSKTTPKQYVKSLMKQ